MIFSSSAPQSRHRCMNSSGLLTMQMSDLPGVKVRRSPIGFVQQSSRFAAA